MQIRRVVAIAAVLGASAGCGVAQQQDQTARIKAEIQSAKQLYTQVNERLCNQSGLHAHIWWDRDGKGHAECVSAEGH